VGNAAEGDPPVRIVSPLVHLTVIGFTALTMAALASAASPSF
jgi:hypothetical protein